jgi:hypothetical protein
MNKQTKFDWKLYSLFLFLWIALIAAAILLTGLIGSFGGTPDFLSESLDLPSISSMIIRLIAPASLACAFIFISHTNRLPTFKDLSQFLTLPTFAFPIFSASFTYYLEMMPMFSDVSIKDLVIYLIFLLLFFSLPATIIFSLASFIILRIKKSIFA